MSREGWAVERDSPSRGRGRPHVDDGVRLDVVHVRVPQAQLLAVPLRRADDARGHRVLQGEGAADGHHKLAGPQVCRVAQKQSRELFLQGGGTTQEGGSAVHLGSGPRPDCGTTPAGWSQGSWREPSGEGQGKSPTQAKARLASS